MGLLHLWIPRCHGLCADRVGGRLSPTSEIDITSSPKSPRLRLPGCRGHQWPNHHRLPASNPRCVVLCFLLVSLEIQPQVSNLRRYRPTSRIHRGGKTSIDSSDCTPWEPTRVGWGDDANLACLKFREQRLFRLFHSLVIFGCFLQDCK